jgi:hypothetical protein
VENRLENRSTHSIELMYGSNDTFCPGSTLNVSPHGMRIHAESQIVPINHDIKLVLTLGNEVISMQGVVCWNSEVLDLEPEADKHLGVFIPDPRPEYIDYIQRLG